MADVVGEELAEFHRRCRVSEGQSECRRRTAAPRPCRLWGRRPGSAANVTGAVLSPAIEEGQHAWHFYDLDTGYRPNWPAHIPRDEAARDPKQLADWASQNGVDLMCITHRSPDGTETYVLRALGMKVREIAARDLRNLDKLIAAGTLPEGRPVGELLMHYDAESQQLVPDANAAFLYITREGSMGVIETTDRVTRTADLTGIAPAAHRQALASTRAFDSI